ncbi:MAG: hypothetical protein H0T76_03250 [Nannocystis sp.]|nr:hypothetical protein [Nannocystis sp.]MBA3545479.1 hypothetical protein [Nannocystis sp.]
MTSSRIKSLSKLALLLGVPVALLLGLFGAGVHCGFQHRAEILAFERDWLGMDVEVPATPEQPVAVTPPATTPESPRPIPPTATPTAIPPTIPPATPAPTDVVSPGTQPEPTGPAALGVVTEPSPLAIAEPLPLSADLQPSLAEPVRVRVKVLVDTELVERRPDWIAYAQRHVAWASQVLEKQVGVHLELRGVVVWPGPTGRDPATLLADLQNRERDGADLLIGLSSRSFAGGPAPVIGEDTNLGFVVAEANPGSRAPHLRGMLHAIGEAFGATPVIGPGTFMGDVLINDRDPIDLDAESRRRILGRKGLPFQALPDAAPGEDAAAPDADEAEQAAPDQPPHRPHRPLPSVNDKDEDKDEEL